MSIQLPDETKALIVRRDSGEFRGQATYWRRGSVWEMIGVTKSLRFLHEVAFENVERVLKSKGLGFKWRKALPFLKHSLQKK